MPNNCFSPFHDQIGRGLTEEEALASLTHRVWCRVDSSSGENVCWPDKNLGRSRGQISYLNRPVTLVRAAWFVTYGRWPVPNANHTCDNESCCNPAHLYEGTQAQNVQDMVVRGRQNVVITYHDPEQFGKLTWEQVREIRRRFKGYWGQLSELAREYGVDKWTIKNIVDGIRWKEKGVSSQWVS